MGPPQPKSRKDRKEKKRRGKHRGGKCQRGVVEPQTYLPQQSQSTLSQRIYHLRKADTQIYEFCTAWRGCGASAPYPYTLLWAYEKAAPSPNTWIDAERAHFT